MEIQLIMLKFFENIRSDILTLVMTIITMMAEGLFIVGILAGLYWCIDKKAATKLSWCVLFSLVGNGIVKNMVKMPRPFEVQDITPIRQETATSYSFPSGHTQTATSFWTSAIIIIKTNPIKIVGTILVILTAISRVYLGVHWPMDVIGGIAFGILLTLLASKLLGENANITMNHVVGTSIVLLTVMCLKVDADLYKSAAALWGMSVGVYIEQNYINFIPYQIKRLQIKKALIGVLGLIVIYIGISKLLPDIKIIDIIKYALIMLWITAGAPYLFKKIK